AVNTRLDVALDAADVAMDAFLPTVVERLHDVAAVAEPALRRHLHRRDVENHEHAGADGAPLQPATLATFPFLRHGACALPTRQRVVPTLRGTPPQPPQFVPGPPESPPADIRPQRCQAPAREPRARSARPPRVRRCRGRSAPAPGRGRPPPRPRPPAAPRGTAPPRRRPSPGGASAA